MTIIENKLNIEENNKPRKWYTFIIEKPKKPVSPFRVLFSLNKTQAITFLAAFLGWSLDAFDFHLVTMALHDIAEDLGYSDSELSSGFTITLLLRPLGAVIFGLLADRFGRRIPLMVDVVLFSLMGLLTGFVQNLTQFLIVRAIFGICMGGEWGLGASLAMESLPPEARGIYSGILQQGFAIGYLLAAFAYWAILPNLGWRVMFYIGSFPALLCIIIRFFVPESEAWKQEQNKVKERSGSTAKEWIKDTGLVFTRHWVLCLFTVILMAAFNSMSHGSQDIFPTYLKTQLEYTASQVSITIIVQNIGAIIGGTLVGWYSEYFGRRRSIALICIIGLFVVPIWGFAGVHSFGIQILGAFLMQFCVQGAWGVIPAYLTEISPPSIRGTFPGLTYQLGNMIASPIPQLLAILGEKISFPDGRPNYALVQSILEWCIMGIIIFLILVSKENSGSNFVTNEPSVDSDIEESFSISVINNKSEEKDI